MTNTSSLPRVAAPQVQPHLAGTLIRTTPGGYGFIKCDDDAEFFVHIQNFPDRQAWAVGQRLRFNRDPLSDPRKAPRAIDISLE